MDFNIPYANNSPTGTRDHHGEVDCKELTNLGVSKVMRKRMIAANVIHRSAADQRIAGILRRSVA